MRYCKILKTKINVTSMPDTLAYIEKHIDALRGSYICVSNVHTTVMSYENEHYRMIQNSAAMALPDGAPLSKYSRMLGFRNAERVTGPDLMAELFRISGKKGYRHFFYGSTQQTLDDMRTALQRNFPDMVIAGMYAPPFRPLTEKEDQEVTAQINDARPDFVWVGLGAPKQEYWMYDHQGKLNAVSVGVGAGFDYMAGNIKRAPGIMQVLCLEWLYRLMQDPKRLWKRYVVTNTKFVRYILRERFVK
ncbi:MAG: WecB/TagA/CpsF family glycosyltransferase [Lachnospiraceae bacterium]|nr:WecB/TagA/CpsF family glycosyltransferase [Lachnospiraceae bacterium]